MTDKDAIKIDFGFNYSSDVNTDSDGGHDAHPYTDTGIQPCCIFVREKAVMEGGS
jgi:hypothetical protein